MKQVIFICTGNTCRSPMAEAIAKSINKNSNLNIFSRGLFVIENKKANSNSIQITKSYNLSLENHISKQITQQEVKNANLILTMSLEHKNIIYNNFDNYENKVYTLYEYVKNSNQNIEDPYGLPLDAYKKCFDELFALIEKIDFDKI